jgi:hypothetical protein
MQNQTNASLLCLLLGASNLARANKGFVNYLERCLHPRPIHFLNALGPGRGYCVPGGILNIVYPPIGDCGILDAARIAKSSHVIALVTDIGNDIMYDIPAGQIIDKLDKLFGDLRRLDADILATIIPQFLENEMDAYQFRCLRTVFFPKSRVEMPAATAAVREINRFLRSEADDRITLITGLEDFYWFDKIHFSPLKMHKAWNKIAQVMFHVLGAEVAEEITLLEMLGSLGSQAFRLTMCDMLRICKKSPDCF